MKLRVALLLLAAPFPLAAACGGTTAPDPGATDAAATGTATGPATSTTSTTSTTTSSTGGPDATPPPPPPPPPADAGPDAPPPDASVDATRPDASAVCVSGPREGAACAPATDVACNRTDLCCSDAKYECDLGTSRWKKVPPGILCLLCLGTPCGTQTCTGNQFCLERTSGIPGGSSSFSCQSYPAACVDDWTCGCVVPAVAGCTAPTCRENPTRHVQLKCQGI